jgi:hypothetical protein
MIEWKRVPWPLWAYSAFVLLGVILILVKAHGPIPVKVLYPCFMLAWIYFLLRGVRWVWIVTVGIYVLGLLPYLISGSLSLQVVALSLFGLLLLLLPATRRYFSSHSAAAGA